MSYASIQICAYDVAFVERVQGCIAQEQLARGEAVDPVQLSANLRWSVAAASDVEQAYAYALLQGTPNPGGDPTVISDAMILSHVQAAWPT